MKLLKDNPLIDGSVLSEELSSIQRQLNVYADYVSKMVLQGSEQQTLVKIEKVEGEQIFLKQLEREEKQRGRKLNATERKKLEKQTKYDLRVAKLGNKTQRFQALFHEITSENKHYHELIELAKKEIERISTQAGAIDKAKSFDPKEHL